MRIEKSIKDLNVLEDGLKKLKTDSKTTVEMTGKIEEQIKNLEKRIADQEEQIKSLEKKKAKVCNAFKSSVKSSVETYKSIKTLIQKEQDEFSGLSNQEHLCALLGGSFLLGVGGAVLRNSKKPQSDQPSKPPEKLKPSLFRDSCSAFAASFVLFSPTAGLYMYKEYLFEKTQTNYEQLTGITNKASAEGEKQLEICK